MRTSSIWDYKFTKFSVSRGIGDAMWRWSMDVANGYPIPPTWTRVEAIKYVGSKKYCLLIGFPLTKTYERSDDSRGTKVSGYSFGWYVANRPMRPSDRLLNTTLSGSTIIVEDPILYLSRLIHSTDNPCGLLKGGWDSAVSGWGTTLPYQQFESSDSSKVQNVIDEISEYTGLLYYDYWKLISNVYQPVTYLKNDTNFDAGFNLPTPITIDAYAPAQLDPNDVGNAIDLNQIQNNRVMVDTESEINGDNWKNSVWVDAVIQGTMAGAFARYPATWNPATMDLERPHQYCYTLPPTTTQAQANAIVAAKAASLYTLLSSPVETFSVKFFNRYDLQLFQKITFKGFAPSIPDQTMRITNIEYTIDGDDGCVCSCQCMTDRSWSAIRKMSISLKRDWAAISDSIKRSQENKTKQIVYGTVINTNPGTQVAVIQSKSSGKMTYAGTPNQ